MALLSGQLPGAAARASTARKRAAEPRPAPWPRRFNLEAGLSLFSPVLLLAVWEALTRLRILDWRFFPAPSAVARVFVSLVTSGELLVDLRDTLGRVAMGFVLGAAPGLALGIVMGLSPRIRLVIDPMVRSLFPIPKIAILPLILLIFGLGELSKWIAIAVGVVFLVLINTMAGVMDIDRIHLDVARNCGASRRDMYRTVALPGALPAIFTGFQQAIGVALLLVVTAEFVGAGHGIGTMMWVAWQKFEIEKMYSGLIVMALLGFLLQQLLEMVAARAVPWKPGLYEPLVGGKDRSMGHERSGIRQTGVRTAGHPRYMR